jgi:hypothetical protein
MVYSAEREDGSILCADVRGFTNFAEETVFSAAVATS